MPAWTEDASWAAPTGEHAALRPRAGEGVSLAGVPWMTILLLLSCGWVLMAAGGVRGGLALSGLLAYGAKATPLILDRGETWRFLAANLLHKDFLHLAFNAFALWNVGGALERAVRPADYLALLVFTALGTTLISAVGSDSISLGASGMAFGVLGASAAFGWRRGVRGSLRSHFGLRIVPWLLALFAAGLGSAGVDNWGHAGGLAVGAAMGCFLTPRSWPSDPAARHLAAAIGALIGTLALGVLAAPMLPALGSPRDGPLGLQTRMPLGWRKAASGPDRITYTNGLTAGFRASASVLAPVCAGKASCACSAIVAQTVREDLWRIADVGPLRALGVRDDLPAKGMAQVAGTVSGSDGDVRVQGACMERDGRRIAVVVLQPARWTGTLARRMAEALLWPRRESASLEAGARR